MFIKKIELMHYLFGKDEGHKCSECSNFCEYRYENAYRKCKVYGCTSSESSDWAKKNIACGMFNKNWDKQPIIERHIRIKTEEEALDCFPIEGQISLF